MGTGLVLLGMAEKCDYYPDMDEEGEWWSFTPIENLTASIRQQLP